MTDQHLAQIAEQIGQLSVQLNTFAQNTIERFEAIELRFDGVDNRFDEVDKHFDEVDERFDAIGKHFDEVNERFDAVDKRFNEIDERFDGVDKRFGAVDGRFTDIEKRLDKLDVRLEKHDEEIKVLAEQILIGQRVTTTKLDALEETILRRLEPLEVVVREHFKGTTPPQAQ